MILWQAMYNWIMSFHMFGSGADSTRVHVQNYEFIHFQRALHLMTRNSLIMFTHVYAHARARNVIPIQFLSIYQSPNRWCVSDEWVRTQIDPANEPHISMNSWPEELLCARGMPTRDVSVCESVRLRVKRRENNWRMVSALWLRPQKFMYLIKITSRNHILIKTKF